MNDQERFVSRNAREEMVRFIESWDKVPDQVERIFLRLRDLILQKDQTVLDFNSRPGVSFSMRAYVSTKSGNQLFALVDVVDDDPENRWLSVCFYAGTVDDPERLGERIPGGILGKDGYCFDLVNQDNLLVRHVERKMQQAYEKVMHDPTVAG